MGKKRSWEKYGWVDDESLLFSVPVVGFRRLPDGHPRRCHGRLRGSNPPIRCSKTTVVGYDYCLTHCRSLLGRSKKHGRLNVRRNRLVRGYYARTVGVALKDRLLELQREEPARRHSLADEVDLARVATYRAVELFEAACMGEERASPDLQASAIGLLRHSLDHVADLVMKASKARRDSLETVDVEQLDFMVDQIVAVLEEEIRPLGEDAVDRCVERLRGIRIPDRKGAGAAPDRAQLARMFRDAAGAIEESVTGAIEESVTGGETETAS